jgi:hypothetical protein
MLKTIFLLVFTFSLTAALPAGAEAPDSPLVPPGDDKIPEDKTQPGSEERMDELNALLNMMNQGEGGQGHSASGGARSSPTHPPSQPRRDFGNGGGSKGPGGGPADRGGASENKEPSAGTPADSPLAPPAEAPVFSLNDLFLLDPSRAGEEASDAAEAPDRARERAADEEAVATEEAAGETATERARRRNAELRYALVDELLKDQVVRLRAAQDEIAVPSEPLQAEGDIRPETRWRVYEGAESVMVSCEKAEKIRQALKNLRERLQMSGEEEKEILEKLQEICEVAGYDAHVLPGEAPSTFSPDRGRAAGVPSPDGV